MVLRNVGILPEHYTASQSKNTWIRIFTSVKTSNLTKTDLSTVIISGNCLLFPLTEAGLGEIRDVYERKRRTEKKTTRSH
jgi:hypothetical protein